jgi:hypothetical protein
MTTNPELAPDMPELLPCPFCGGEATYESTGWGEGKHIIYCLEKYKECHLCPRLHYNKIDISKEMMFELWNRRADLAPQAGSVDVEGFLEDLETLRWLLNKSSDDDTPRITIGSAMDRHENSKGESNRIILERLYKTAKTTASRNLLAGAPVGGGDRPAIPGLQEAIERREKLLATKRTLGHENRGIHTEGDPIFEAAKLYASCQSGAPDGWQPIESAPRDGTMFLGAKAEAANYPGPMLGYFCAYWSAEHCCFMYSSERPCTDLTHWMPLPSPPNKETISGARDGRD